MTKYEQIFKIRDKLFSIFVSLYFCRFQPFAEKSRLFWILLARQLAVPACVQNERVRPWMCLFKFILSLPRGGAFIAQVRGEKRQQRRKGWINWRTRQGTEVTPTEPKTSKANSWSDINSRCELRNLRNFENRDFLKHFWEKYKKMPATVDAGKCR